MAPRVVFVGLASDFGCQVQITNMEDHLLDVLGTIDLVYWQLASSGHMPDAYDVAVIEGAVTTDEHEALLKRVRETAAVVVAIGACAVLGGIPALAGTGDLEQRFATVYGAGAPVARGRRAPAPVESVISVDYHVPGCPIDPAEFVRVLNRAVRGLADRPAEDPLCALCKTNENLCLLDSGQPCLGLITRTGCGAICVSRGRACTGCRGLSPVANLAAARVVFADKGLDPARIDQALSIYNSYGEAAR